MILCPRCGEEVEKVLGTYCVCPNCDLSWDRDTDETISYWRNWGVEDGDEDWVKVPRGTLPIFTEAKA